MNQVNYYDKIAPIYDQTRWLTESVAEEVADFLVELVAATADTCFLEPGVGTGLNVFPLVKRGYAVTGIDVSQEMLQQFWQKFPVIPDNLRLIRADSSKLPFLDNSFDVVLTVHMLHTVANWQKFLDDIHRVLKPQGFYLNAQWITPPARREFEGYFRAILAKHRESVEEAMEIIEIDEYFQRQGYLSSYHIAKEWMVDNSVEELLGFFKPRAYGLCWQVKDEVCARAMDEFEEFCLEHYGSLKTVLSSVAKFEIWSYTRR